MDRGGCHAVGHSPVIDLTRLTTAAITPVQSLLPGRWVGVATGGRQLEAQLYVTALSGGPDGSTLWGASPTPRAAGRFAGPPWDEERGVVHDDESGLIEPPETGTAQPLSGNDPASPTPWPNTYGTATVRKSISKGLVNSVSIWLVIALAVVCGLNRWALRFP
jgi:hypothetical protein